MVAATGAKRFSACRSVMGRATLRFAVWASSTSPTGLAATDSPPTDRKLVSAVANQIGAAVEMPAWSNATCSSNDVSRELELAHDLQLKLLPCAIGPGGRRAGRRALLSGRVGWRRLLHLHTIGRGRVGVMLGDVSSHGYSAALVVALVMAAAGIHAAASLTPDETLAALQESLATELATTEMYFTVFYGMLDPLTRTALLRERGSPPCVSRSPASAIRRSDSKRPLHPWGSARQEHSAAGSCPGRRNRPARALDRWTGGRPERGGRAVTARAAPRPQCVPTARRVARGDRARRLADAEAFGPTADRRPHHLVMRIYPCPGAKRRLGQHFLTDPRLLGPHRRRCWRHRVTTRCWRWGRGREGSPPHLLERAGRAGRNRERPRAGARA